MLGMFIDIIDTGVWLYKQFFKILQSKYRCYRFKLNLHTRIFSYGELKKNYPVRFMLTRVRAVKDCSKGGKYIIGTKKIQNRYIKVHNGYDRLSILPIPSISRGEGAAGQEGALVLPPPHLYPL